MSGAAPGWYPQPDGTQRYWDGSAWTEHIAPGAGQPTYGQPTYGQPQYTNPYGPRVEAKQPALMLLASFFIPGLGTILNGETGKGIGIMVGYFVSIPLVLILIGFPMMIGFWIWGMVDAYQGAQNWNRRHGIVA